MRPTRWVELPVLVVDDRRTFRFPAAYARTSKEALDLINADPEKHWAEVWLDHDLGGDDTTMPVVDRLVQRAFQAYPPNRIVVHTQNPVGRQRIIQALTPYYPVLNVDPIDYIEAPEE